MRVPWPFLQTHRVTNQFPPGQGPPFRSTVRNLAIAFLGVLGLPVPSVRSALPSEAPSRRGPRAEDTDCSQWAGPHKPGWLRDPCLTDNPIRKTCRPHACLPCTVVAAVPIPGWASRSAGHGGRGPESSSATETYLGDCADSSELALPNRP